MTIRSTVLAAALAVLSLSACGDRAQKDAPPAAAGPVDSIRPPEVAMARFREGLVATDTLVGGYPSRDSLLAAFGTAVAKLDTAALRGMVLSRAEWAYIMFPSMQRMNPGLNMQPDVMWMMQSQESEKGIVRVVRRLGNGQAALADPACEDAPQVEGENRFWHRCDYQVTVPEGESGRLHLFGSVIERGGRYKIVSYANDF